MCEKGKRVESKRRSRLRYGNSKNQDLTPGSSHDKGTIVRNQEILPKSKTISSSGNSLDFIMHHRV